MAKDFVFRIAGPHNMCMDRCSFLNNGTMIGSSKCHHCCPNNKQQNNDNCTITCPKIMYRHYTGKVVMRKK